MNTVVAHWALVGLMAATFILFLKLVVVRFVPIPGLAAAVGAI